MIPKTIHYCWFGKKQLPPLAQECIASWHRHMPDWDYRLWDEDSFDIDSTPYTSEAYKAGKYAFVSDYVRLWALHNEGGVYLDTDVEVLRKLDDLLYLKAFTGYEGSKHLPPVTGLMASESKGVWVEEQLHAYEKRHFLLPDGSLDTTTNTQRITAIMISNGFVCDGRLRQYKDLTVFPTEYFCPRQTTGELLLTQNTYCDHHFLQSWANKEKGWKNMLLKLFDSRIRIRIIKLKRRLLDR